VDKDLEGQAMQRGNLAMPDEERGPALALTPAVASRFAGLVLGCVRREFPAKMDHVLLGPGDVRGPRDLHPAFYGCFDWHSAVHGHWTLARLLRLFPDLPEAGAMRGVLAEHLAPEPLAGEVVYFCQPGRQSFERTYGWAWLLKLAAELMAWDAPEARGWSANLWPLAAIVVQRFHDFLPRQTYPIRTGVHPNTAFSLGLALDYAKVSGDRGLEALLVERALSYFLEDRSGAVGAEPGGEDFVSPCLEEAALMGRILPRAAFGKWLRGFLPGLGAAAILTPALVSDRSDPKIVHLDGLNLSRGRALRDLAAALGRRDGRRPALERAARLHGEAALPHVASGNYGGDHWLATFALRLLELEPTEGPPAA
jgi:hypothetical protein